MSKFIKSKVYLTYACQYATDEHLQSEKVKAIIQHKYYIEEKEGYICKVEHDNKSLYFVLVKADIKGTWWNISELSTGSSFNSACFKNRDQAIDYIIEYDYEVFNKLYNCLQNVNNSNTPWFNTLAEFNKNNMQILETEKIA